MRDPGTSIFGVCDFVIFDFMVENLNHEITRSRNQPNLVCGVPHRNSVLEFKIKTQEFKNFRASICLNAE